ncbi:hypothetical protein PENNAL_c0025G01301 [Penicillium nalgiovense]|uniref:Zn(2)-C6 fungal-type domain-containing protein n=1 Tax=Penicillium nalgiovense TaxID=60175 RepID=A0A1V6YBZ1_PENNA|nr:hypothetical protein PENNAL_c0025G01301 [Penicillium nalgiovense]
MSPSLPLLTVSILDAQRVELINQYPCRFVGVNALHADRCTGPPHCTECSTHGRDCVFDEAADRRRKASAKRIQDQLDHFRSFVDDLIGLIRDSDGPTVQLIVNSIRSGATPGEIRDILTRLLEDDNPSDSRNSGVRDSNLNLNITPNNNMGNYFNPSLN